MSRNLERIVGVAVALVLVAMFFVMGRSGANTTIDNAQATVAALQNTVNELLDRPDLSGELADAEAALDAAYTEVAELSATEAATSTPVATATTRPTATAIPPTPTPKPCYPSNLDEVVAIRDPRVNLFEVIGENGAGKFIMGIYEDDNGNRVQYEIGVTFFVYEDGIVVDGGSTFYEVFGPLGKGLYVREVHIKLFDADPDLYFCQ